MLSGHAGIYLHAACGRELSICPTLPLGAGTAQAAPAARGSVTQDKGPYRDPAITGGTNPYRGIKQASRREALQRARGAYETLRPEAYQYTPGPRRPPQTPKAQGKAAARARRKSKHAAARGRERGGKGGQRHATANHDCNRIMPTPLPTAATRSIPT